ncbi:hypothetical protein GCM10011571_22640 [Marinithermofilum abyssi]|uniref:DUF3153 domain-containing protein n=1 Tax=Marinithermofilum abyssi TaxID=1571185 RepID=A0A8J2VFG7_9BACL|nr:DUF3153 domain-containing protein [Marinithermofilum abyssi]GGE20161.1 hypothetical protein GCM10011571_22640 [Marinithermofilum abyssi]
MVRKRKGIAIILLFTLLLTGCVNADVHITVNKDGSGTYEMKLLSHPLIADQLEPMKKKIEKKGYQVKNISQGNQTGWIAVKKVDNIANEPPTEDFKDLSPTGKSASMLPLTDMKKGPVSVDVRPFTYLITLKTNADLQSMGTDNFLGQAVMDQVHLRFKLTLPIKPDKSNADEVSPDGKTLTWKLKPGKKNPIFVQAALPNPIGWGAVILGAILVLVVLVIVWVIRRKKKRAGINGM